MTTISCYYPSFQISPSFPIPEFLRTLLEKVWQYHYEELYEEEAVSTTLEDTFSEVLDALEDKDNYSCHSRYICMALIFALAVELTVKNYLVDDTRPEQIFQWVAKWSENKTVPGFKTIDELFPHNSIGTQAIDEALDVFRNLLRVLDHNQAREALLEILDDCFEGYAIFPGSNGRRDLFNWWLLEVVPASWCLQFPETIYTVQGIQYLNPNLIKDRFPNIFHYFPSQVVIQNSSEAGAL